jgi:ribosomal protein S15P/S13E
MDVSPIMGGIFLKNKNDIKSKNHLCTMQNEMKQIINYCEAF